MYKILYGIVYVRDTSYNKLVDFLIYINLKEKNKRIVYRYEEESKFTY